MEKFQIGLYKSLKKDPLNAFLTNELNYALFPNDDAVTFSIIKGWQYEWYIFDFLTNNQIVTKGKTIIDVGGNNGNFAVDFAHLVGNDGVVHTFEPQRIIYYQLCTNIFLNGLTNVHCHNEAIGNIDGELMIETPNYLEKNEPVNFGGAEIVNEGGELVKSTRLDSRTFKDVVFIKIDVQGYESFVIEGAINTIQKHRPYMFVEFEDHLLQKQESSEAKLQAQIEALDYIVKPFQPGVPYQSYSGKCLDYVCIPREKWEEFEHIIP
jgi:FkbM family methyltransferase